MIVYKKLNMILDSYKCVYYKDEEAITRKDALKALEDAYNLGIAIVKPKEDRVDYHISPRQTKIEF